MLAILDTTFHQVLTTFAHNWPFLVAGTVIAATLKVYADQAAIARFFRAHGATSVLLATLLAIATPLCSCGTMAVILGMMASSVPWAPIVAFMAASPLTSPQETLISAGLLGWPFALTLLAASLVIGLAAGAAAHALERRGWLAGQARVAAVRAPARPASGLPVIERRPRSPRLTQVRDELLRGGVRLLAMFAGFAFIGYFLNNLIPAAWVSALFGRSNRFGVAAAALVGLPLYLNSDASLPMVRAFVDNGAGTGAALAFIITGAGTSLGAISGALTIARWRVIAVVVAALLAGAIAAGYGFDLLAPGPGAS